MWNKLSNKKKFFRMLIGAAVLVWLSFKFGVMPSMHLKQELDQLEAQLKNIEDAPYKLQGINDRLKHIEQQIGDISGDEGRSGYLIDKVGAFCKKNGMLLSEIPQKHTFVKDEYIIVTYKLVVQGSFVRLVKLLDEIEKKPLAGKVRSVTFESEYDLKSKRTFLYGIFYIQSVLYNEK